MVNSYISWEKISYACKRLEKKQIEIKEEPFIECNPPLQELSFLSYELLSSLLQWFTKEKKQNKEENYTKGRKLH